MKKKIIIGNWKMGPSTPDEAKKIFLATRKIAQKSTKVEVVVCPPAVYISSLVNLAKGVKVGAQTTSSFIEGSHTGEMTSSMLVNSGAKYIVVGHSERRAMGESDLDISKKVKSVLAEGITPVLCVGEQNRDEHGGFFAELKNQLINSLSGVAKVDISKIIFAYEPVWAIGGKTALEPKDVHESILFLKKILAEVYDHDIAMEARILYGGSVNVRNARDIVDLGKVDGVLVGRDSLNHISFPDIISQINTIK
jgi:triosephosphate isomerase